MRENNSSNTWNSVLRFIQTMKQNYRDIFHTEPNLNYEKPYHNCIEAWVDKFQNPIYTDIIQRLIINQYGNNVIFHYKSYELTFIQSDEENISEINRKNFWDVYDGLFRECRGIVLDVENETIVSTPFPKFFNLGERDEVSMDEITIRAYF